MWESRDAVTLANDAVADCPNTKVMAGYSQGTMVVHQAEVRLAASSRKTVRRIVETLLLGDSDRVPFTRAHEFGSSLPRAEGIAPTFTGIVGAMCRPSAHGQYLQRR
jgi:Cutinase